MKIKLNQKLKNMDGSDLIENEVTIDLKKVILGALLNVSQKNNVPLTGEEKFNNYQLAEKVNKANEVDLKVEEIVLIKEMIGLVYSAIVVGQAYNMLEGK